MASVLTYRGVSGPEAWTTQTPSFWSTGAGPRKMPCSSLPAPPRPPARVRAATAGPGGRAAVKRFYATAASRPFAPARGFPDAEEALVFARQAATR